MLNQHAALLVVQQRLRLPPTTHLNLPPLPITLLNQHLLLIMVAEVAAVIETAVTINDTKICF
jgi:hypothetical protein